MKLELAFLKLVSSIALLYGAGIFIFLFYTECYSSLCELMAYIVITTGIIGRLLYKYFKNKYSK